uniref:Secreted protein n=1 Tax=Acrobeloides nanus TaxID=290746 RepID=A0A914CFC6_9BILA
MIMLQFLALLTPPSDPGGRSDPSASRSSTSANPIPASIQSPSIRSLLDSNHDSDPTLFFDSIPVPAT